MSFTVQHKRSSELNRRPLPQDLAEGQVAINSNDDTPGMFIRTQNAALVKIGPCAIGNNSPAPTNYTTLTVGEMWLDTSLTNVNRLKVWNGTEWLIVS